ncbi:hypothetical protein OF83DRAFT_1083056 [Amylostereum chailletii]|nr:hypothetical protein OF83DRAFT_1083056 [Amylostereum chailletii]
MTNWHDPSVVLNSYKALANSSGVVEGLVFVTFRSWEFVTNINFDWAVLSGRRRRPWTFWFRKTSTGHPGRFSIVNLRKITTLAGIVVASGAFWCSSCIILIRVIAIWERDMFIILVGWGVWLGNVAALVYDVIVASSSCDFTAGGSLNNPPFPVWQLRFVPIAGGECTVENAQKTLAQFVMFLATELFLLSLMLAGLLKRRMGTSRPMGVWRTLHSQGWIWLLLSMIAESPNVVLLVFNLNDGPDSRKSIGAARMYRGFVLSFQDIGTARADLAPSQARIQPLTLLVCGEDRETRTRNEGNT